MKIKETTQSFGSSFYGDEITVSPNEIIQKLGKPVNSDNDGTDKTNFDFDFELEDETPFTLYDWKYYHPLEMDEKYEFHIGARNGAESKKVYEVLKTLF